MGSMVFGYARVSTQDQELARQIDALEKYGVDEVFTEKMTSTKASRPELNRLKDKVRLTLLRGVPDLGLDAALRHSFFRRPARLSEPI